MSISSANDVAHYEAYARHCLKMASQIPNRDSRLMLREMAAEWLNLAEPAGPTEDTGARAPQTDAAASD